jgi:hypothetical protein
MKSPLKIFFQNSKRNEYTNLERGEDLKRRKKDTLNKNFSVKDKQNNNLDLLSC